MIDSLETIAGLHGVGRIDLWPRVSPAVSRARSTRPRPRSCCTRRTRSSSSWSSRRTSSRWRTPSAGPTPISSTVGNGSRRRARAIDAFVAAIQPRVTGAIRLKLFKGDCRVAGRRSPFAQSDVFRRLRPRTLLPPDLLPAASSKFIRRALHQWHICGQDGLTEIPTRRWSRSGGRSASIAGSSKTTCAAAWPGRRRSRARAC